MRTVNQKRKLGGDLWALFGILSLLASVGSVLMLVRHALNVGLAEPLKLVLDEYEFWLHAFFGWWADPLLKALLVHVGRWIGLDLQLSPEWKHVFLLLWIYFVAGARVDRFHQRPASVAFTLVWGGIVALIASATFGSLPLKRPSSKVLSAAIPILGVVFYEFGRRAWNATFFRAQGESWHANFNAGIRSFALPVAIIGLAVLFLGLALREVTDIDASSSPGLVTVLGFIMLLSGTWLIRGIGRATRHREPGETWMHRFRRSGSGLMSMYMIAVIGASLLFLLANAGVKLLERL